MCIRDSTKDRLTWMATPLLYGARDTSGPVAARRSSFGLVPVSYTHLTLPTSDLV